MLQPYEANLRECSWVKRTTTPEVVTIWVLLRSNEAANLVGAMHGELEAEVLTVKNLPRRHGQV